MSAPYVPLAEFAASFGTRADTLPDWVHAVPMPLSVLDSAGVRTELDDVLDTIVAVQRAEWVQDGVYLGPKSMPDAWRDLLDASRALQIAVPPAVVSPSPSAVVGTDDRALINLNSFFLAGATPGERRLLIGRLCGFVAARQVSWQTTWALLVDQGGLRTLARKALGPALEVFLAPLSFGVRLALAPWHRGAEISADRAGLVVCDDLGSARKAMLRGALGVNPKVSPEDYLDQLKSAQEDGSPAKWAELLRDRPFVYKRMRAIELFARSSLWVDRGHAPLGTPVLDVDALRFETDRLLQVS
jgi:hypothetical protein